VKETLELKNFVFLLNLKLKRTFRCGEFLNSNRDFINGNKIQNPKPLGIFINSQIIEIVYLSIQFSHF